MESIVQSNLQLELAEAYVATTGVSVFLTGKAGTGKTTFLRRLVSTTHKRHVVLAPTGVAAVNAGGSTIHSFFQLSLCPYLPDVKELVTEYQMPQDKFKMRKERMRLIRSLELLIIDEISMVRADLLDAVDMVLRRIRRSSRPFGGVQLLLIGDVHQLPPVVRDDERPYMDQVYPSPFFFHSKALQRIQLVTIELQHIYRQQDASFVEMLNQVRDNRCTPEVLAQLNSRHVKDFDPDSSGHSFIRLTTHNHQADAVNRSRLDALDTEERLYSAKVQGTFPDSFRPTDPELTLKVGEQVMFVKNDSSGKRRYYNGKIATIASFDDDGVNVVDEQGTAISVQSEEWTNMRYDLNPDTNEIEARVEGLFVQMPLRPAWAITIHKAQGLTFDHVVVDAGAAFSFGQVYVALSRCRTFEGLVLSSPISAHCLFDNVDVRDFCSSQPSEQQMREVLPECQQSYYLEQLADLFDFAGLHRQAERLGRLFSDNLRATYPEQASLMSQLLMGPIVDMMTVGEKFVRQLRRMVAAGSSVDDRVDKGSSFFLDRLAEVGAKLPGLVGLEIDAKEVEKAYKESTEQLLETFGVKQACLKHVGEHGFSVEGCQKARVEYLLEKDAPPKKVDPFDELAHPKLARMLRQWRYLQSQELNIPAYAIMSQKTLMAIADQLPRDKKALGKMPAFGKSRMARYGIGVMDVIGRYCAQNGLGSLSMELDTESPQKTDRVPSYRKSVELFVSGVEIEQIMEQRGLSRDSVCNHLTQAYEKGELDIDLLLTAEEQDEMVQYFLESRSSDLTKAYEHFAQRHPYYKLRIARHFAQTIE